LTAAQRNSAESLRHSRDELLVAIEDQRRIERALRRSEMYLAEAQKLSRTGSFGFNVSTGDIFWSEETFRIFEYNPTMKPTLDLALQRVHPDDLALVQQLIEFASGEAEGLNYEHRLLMPDGSVKHVQIVARAVKDASGGIEFVGAVMDVTAARRAEMLLAGEKHVLEMIAKGDLLPLVLNDLCQLVEERASGSQSSILLLDPNANRLRHGAAPSLPMEYTEAIDGLVIGPSVGSCGTAAYRAEQVIVSDIATDPLWADYRDLAVAHALRACWSTPILSSAGRVLGTFAIYYGEPRSPTPQEHDVIEQITHLASIAVERKQSEEALRQAQAELAHATRVTTLGELTASIAHEVNQPLAGVVSSGNACMRWLASEPPNIEKARQSVDRIIRDANRASEVVARVRSLAKKAPLQKGWLNLNDMVLETTALTRMEVAQHRASLSTQLSDAGPLVWADRIQLQQVIINLIMNAVEAVSAVSDGPRDLFISTAKYESDGVLFTVRDSGTGLDPEKLERIFNAFYTTKPEGMGMGLAVSRSIIEGHGGRLWASPNEPRGAVFQFTLPGGREKGS
jgi:signal transduction histidine kinase